MDSGSSRLWRNDSLTNKDMNGLWTDLELQSHKEWVALQTLNCPMQEPRVICVQMLRCAKQNGSELVGFERAELAWRWESERVRRPQSDPLTQALHQRRQAR